jgi:hypothetical protein
LCSPKLHGNVLAKQANCKLKILLLLLVKLSQGFLRTVLFSSNRVVTNGYMSNLKTSLEFTQKYLPILSIESSKIRFYLESRNVKQIPKGFMSVPIKFITYNSLPKWKGHCYKLIYESCNLESINSSFEYLEGWFSLYILNQSILALPLFLLILCCFFVSDSRNPKASDSSGFFVLHMDLFFCCCCCFFIVYSLDM